MTLIPAIAIVNPRTMSISQNKKAAFWLSLKTKLAMLSTTVRESGCMLSSEASGTTTSTQLALLVTGPLQVQLFATSSHFYVFVPGDGRLMSCGRRITAARSGPHWLGRLRRQHSIPMTLTMAASASTRSPWNPWIPMSRLMNRLTRLDRRN